MHPVPHPSRWLTPARGSRAAGWGVLAACGLGFAHHACSAGGAPADQELRPAPSVPGGATPDVLPDVIVPPSPGTGTPGGRPANLGSETLCDGIDENGNGIIDDVDVGGDGLCDCINIGFFGEIASDAGSSTTAFETWLVERSGQIPIKRLAATDTLTAEWLASLQVLVVGGLRQRVSRNGTGSAFDPSELLALEDWLTQRGGGMFTLSGYTADAADAQPTSDLLAAFGLAYDLGSVPPEGVIGQGAPPVWLSSIVAPTHPTVEGVAEIGFYYGYPVLGEGTVILTGQGYDLAIAKEVGSGRIFAFGDEWITQDVTWSGTSIGGADDCQQPCNEQQNLCRIAAEQCDRCALEPCSDPSAPDPATCSKGCQPSCDSERARCVTNTASCESCVAARAAREQSTARLWLNTFRWLTPENECQVEIPPVIRVR